MDQDKARALALAEMRKWGLLSGPKPWHFALNRRKRALGLCSPGKRTIYLSSYYLTKVSEVETLDTIRHEIAHALDFDRNGKSDHGPRWKAIAREVGAKDERCFTGKVAHAYTYVIKYEDTVVRGMFKLPKDLLAKLPLMQMRARPDTKGKLKLYRLHYGA